MESTLFSQVDEASEQPLDSVNTKGGGFIISSEGSDTTEVIDKVQEEKTRTDRKPPGVGRGRGRGVDDGGARGRGRGAPMAKMSGNRGAGRGRG
ncbi:hypothetical protein DY000_02025922 [Brassica cretica]|uniref:AT-hook motif nuclear-localized protein n=1 Tax=Brassica cretica TaxID=69181 RepID=A0ABQ7ENH9_BRACR|nr:hypothetical protein DY000_02025922 [Brassica cretica]